MAVGIVVSGRRLWLPAFLGFCLLHAGWALATPYNGPPDEQQHVLRAAGVAAGELFAQQDLNGGLQHVPDSLYRKQCFPMRADVAADCDVEPGGEGRVRLLDTSAARFNPVYYAVTAWPVGVWPSWRGIMLARLLNGAAMAALLACAVVAAARWTRHRAMVAGVVVASTPMIAHLGGAVNPNGVEIAAGAAMFAALMALVHEQRQGVNRAAVALAAVSAIVIVTPRFTGVMWLFVLLGVVLVPSPRARLRELARSSAVRWWSLVVVVATAASVAWTVLVKPADPTGWDHKMTPVGVLKVAVLDVWPTMANQMVGVMGWMDTAMPRLVYVVWFMAVGLLLLGGFVPAARVDRWRTLALFFGTFTPLVVLELLSANQIGWFNQGRYFLTGAVALPMFGAYVLAKHVLDEARIHTLTTMFAVLLLPVHLVCLAYTMARWQSGLRSLNPLDGSWTPPYGAVLPLAAATLGLALLFLAYRRATQPTDVGSPEHLTATASTTRDVAHV